MGLSLQGPPPFLPSADVGSLAVCPALHYLPFLTEVPVSAITEKTTPYLVNGLGGGENQSVQPRAF